MKRTPSFTTIVSLLAALLLCTAATNKVRPTIGIVKEAEGAPDVLRNPQDTVTPHLKQKSQKMGYVITLFKDQYWETYRVQPGTKLYYGDQLSSGQSSRMHIELENGIEITLAPNTAVRLSRAFVENQNQSLIDRWVSIVSGTIRAKARGEKNPRSTGFRTNSIAMGVRGTDFVVESLNGKSKLVTIEGEVSARPVSPRENEIFQQLSKSEVAEETPSPAVKSLQEELTELAAKVPETVVARGEKIELPEPAFEEQQGLALTAPTRASSEAPILSKAAANAADVAAISTITDKLSAADTKADEQNLNSLKDETLPDSTNEAVPSTGPTLGSYSHLFSIGLTGMPLEIVNQNGDSINFAGSSISIDYTWFPFQYFGIGAIVVSHSELEGDASTIFDPPEKASFDDRPIMSALKLTGLYEWRLIGFGASFNLWRKIAMSLDHDTTTGRQILNFNAKLEPMINLRTHYRFRDRYLALLELGGTNVRFYDFSDKVPSVLDGGLPAKMSFFRLGVGMLF